MTTLVYKSKTLRKYKKSNRKCKTLRKRQVGGSFSFNSLGIQKQLTPKEAQRVSNQRKKMEKKLLRLEQLPSNSSEKQRQTKELKIISNLRNQNKAAWTKMKKNEEQRKQNENETQYPEHRQTRLEREYEQRKDEILDRWNTMINNYVYKYYGYHSQNNPDGPHDDELESYIEQLHKHPGYIIKDKIKRYTYLPTQKEWLEHHML